MAKKKIVEQSRLAKALQFLELTFKAGEEQAMYCMMDQHIARSFNSIVAAGTSIEEDLTACPHTGLLLTAVLRCPASYAITQLSPEKLLVRSEEFQAYIPCVAPDSLSWPIPDPLMAPVDDRLLVALRKVAPLIVSKPETLIEASIQLNAGSCLATNLSVIMEAWHGFDLPSGLLLPKMIVTAMHKSKKKLSGFGYSEKTATFYFEDDSWMRTQLFQNRWPEVQSRLQHNDRSNTRPVPPDLFKAARKVAPFSVDENVYVKDSLISSHSFKAKEEGSALKLPIGSEHAERVYNIRNLALIAPHVELWDEIYRTDGTFFYGDNCRGLIAHHIPILRDDHDTEDIPF